MTGGHSQLTSIDRQPRGGAELAYRDKAEPHRKNDSYFPKNQNKALFLMAPLS